jgi:hypothetical protein
MHDYDLDIVLIGVVHHRFVNGTDRAPVGRFARELSDDFDDLIRQRTVGMNLDAKQRTIIAVLASIAHGPSPVACVDVAIQEYRELNQ